MITSEILDISIEDFLKLDKKTLSKYVSQLASTANKRLKRLESAQGGVLSPAYSAIKRSKGGTHFFAKGKNLNELRGEFTRVSQFLRNKTSTVKGWKTTFSEFRERIGVYLTPEETLLFWNVYNNILKDYPDLIGKLHVSSDELQRAIGRFMYFEKNPSDIIEKVKSWLAEEYDERIEDISYIFSDDDFFEGGNF